MPSPAAQQLLQAPSGTTSDFIRPSAAAQTAHRSAQRLTPFQSGRVTLLGPGRGLPKPELAVHPHTAVLESPVFLPIGLVRLRSALPTGDVVATTAATRRACLSTHICVLAALKAVYISFTNIDGTCALLDAAARRGALAHDRHCPAPAAISGQQRQHDPHSATVYGQRGLCEWFQRPRQQRRLRGILGGHRPTTDRSRSAGSRLLCCRRTTLTSFMLPVDQHSTVSDGIQPELEGLHTDP
jgi:hypothetical protein